MNTGLPIEQEFKEVGNSNMDRLIKEGNLEELLQLYADKRNGAVSPESALGVEDKIAEFFCDRKKLGYGLLTLCTKNCGNSEQREDIRQDFLLHLFDGGIEHYLSLKGLSFFSYCTVKCREIYSRNLMDNNTMKFYNAIKKISEEHGIQIRKENAYLFEHFGKGKNGMTINQIIRTIDEAENIHNIIYAESFDARKDSFSTEDDYDGMD